MSMSSKVCLAWLLLGSVTSACAPHGPSTVAKGEYYSSRNPRYAEFFIGLFNRQIEMENALKVPPAAHRALTEAVQLPSAATLAELEGKLREKALELSRTGLRLRLDREADGRVVLRASSRPKNAFVDTVESVATELAALARSLETNDSELNRLERQTIELDANVDTAFSGRERTEAKQNLADAHKLLALMRTRSSDLAATTSAQLDMLRKALNTDDGSLSTSPERAPEASAQAPPSEPKKPTKAAAKPRAAAAPRPKPVAPAKPVEATPKPIAPSKPAPAPRDFEP